MAEFCTKCFEKINDIPGSNKPYKYALGEDFCECCGKWRKDCVYDTHAGLSLQLIQFIKFKMGCYDTAAEQE